MTKCFLIIGFLIASVINLFGQRLKNRVYQKFMTADSVILVSHLTTCVPIGEDKITHRFLSLRLVEKNRPNYKIVKEYYRVSAKEIDSVATILLIPNTDSLIEDVKCFMPHHGILIFKRNRCSYFDICFGCRHFITSKDIKLSDELNSKTWDQLEFFFSSRKLSYGLSLDDSETNNNN